MPHKDPEVRKEYLQNYYKKNSNVIKLRTKEKYKENSLDPLFNHKKYLKYKHYDKSKKHLLRYGITQEEYNRMFEEQDGCCKICDRHQSEFKRSLAVDHCHRTGKIRGLLCANCNTAIGKLGDNVEGLRKALEYLERSL